MKLWMKIFIGMILGIFAGLLIGKNAVYLKPLGTIFLNLINMVIVLLIFSSMTVGITRMHDPKKLSRVGLKTIGIYFTTTFIAISLGLFVAYLFKVGMGVSSESVEGGAAEAQSVKDILMSIVPSNPIASMVNGNILQIIVFAILLGIAINFSGEKGKPLLNFLESLSDVMYRLTSIIMEFSPIGVFGIMAGVANEFGLDLIKQLSIFLGLYYIMCFFQFFIVYGFILKGMARLDFIPFFRGMGDATMTAFSTCSSAATLPVAMHCVQENLGVSKNISGFVLPLGITMNMNGTAIYQAMSAVFIANAFGHTLSISDYFTVILTSTLSAIGTAGVPGGGFIMLSAVLTSVGLPPSGVKLLVGIDRLREMMSTALNILGDAIITVFIAKQENELDEKKYNHSELVAFESVES